MWLVDFNAGKTQLVSFDQPNNHSSIDVKMDGSVLEEKSSFKMLGLTFSSKVDWGSYMITIAKTASKKIGALICSIKFLFPQFVIFKPLSGCFKEATETIGFDVKASFASCPLLHLIR